METQVLTGLLIFSGAIIAALLGLVGMLLRRNNKAVAGGSNNHMLHDILGKLDEISQNAQNNHGAHMLAAGDLRGDLRNLKTLVNERLPRKDGGDE